MFDDVLTIKKKRAIKDEDNNDKEEQKGKEKFDFRFTTHS
jgi:hypothetical protein